MDIPWEASPIGTQCWWDALTVTIASPSMLAPCPWEGFGERSPSCGCLGVCWDQGCSTRIKPSTLPTPASSLPTIQLQSSRTYTAFPFYHFSHQWLIRGANRERWRSFHMVLFQRGTNIPLCNSQQTARNHLKMCHPTAGKGTGGQEGEPGIQGWKGHCGV